ncbi:MAG: hypothetical protein ACPHJ3_11460 [Rubripirellula sp.]
MSADFPCDDASSATAEERMAKVEQIVIEITSTAGIESLFFIIIQFLESRNGKHQRLLR